MKIIVSGTGIAGSHENRLNLFCLRHFPSQRMLAATAADDEYLHGVIHLL